MDDNGSAFCGNATCLFEKSRLIPPHQSLTRQRLMRGDHYDKPKILCSIPKKAERHMARSAFLIVRPL